MFLFFSVASSSGSVKGSFEDSSSAVEGSVHSNRNWFKELEESFMVSMSLYIFVQLNKLDLSRLLPLLDRNFDKVTCNIKLFLGKDNWKMQSESQRCYSSESQY